jgi:hypothetical protein
MGDGEPERGSQSVTMKSSSAWGGASSCAAVFSTPSTTVAFGAAGVSAVASIMKHLIRHAWPRARARPQAKVCPGAGREGESQLRTYSEVRVEPIDAPADLLAALRAAGAGVLTAFEAMSYSHRKEWIVAISGAKRPETRAKRVADCVAAMRIRSTAAPVRRRKPA